MHGVGRIRGGWGCDAFLLTLLELALVELASSA